MKKIWTSLLVLIGFGSSAYADCYNQTIGLINEGSDDKELTLSYCAEIDLAKIQMIEEVWPFLVETDEKIKIATEYKNITKRLKDFGYGDFVSRESAGRCELCVVNP